MEHNKFQLNFGWGNIVAFVFFSLVSFTTIFLLGILVGKNSAISVQEIILPVETKTKVEQNTPQKQTTPALKVEQNTPQKQTTPQQKKKKAKPKKLVISQETQALFGKNDYVIQLISYKSKTKAESLQRLLKDNFYPSYILVFSQDKQTYYRVRVGSYSLAEAKRVAKDLAKQFPVFTNTRIFKIRK